MGGKAVEGGMGIAEQTNQSGKARLIQAALLRIHALGRQGLLAPA
jgi:hypothetical protein